MPDQARHDDKNLIPEVNKFKNMASSVRQQENRLGWMLLGPSISFIVVLIVYPLFYNLYLSFFDARLSGDKLFVGLANYGHLLADPAFYHSVVTTAIFLLGTVFGSTVVGLLVALLLNIRFPLRNIVRSLVLLPYVAPVISVVFGWQFIFDPVNGIFNHLIVDVLHLSSARHSVMGNSFTALAVVILFDIWKHFPIAYLLLLARLQAIDKELYEASALDGCGPLRRFFNVTLPELHFVLGTIVLLRLIWNLNKFEEVFLLAPNVKTLPVFMYYTAFTGSIDQGTGAAIAMIQLVVLGSLIYLYVKRILKW